MGTIHCSHKFFSAWHNCCPYEKLFLFRHWSLSSFLVQWNGTRVCIFSFSLFTIIKFPFRLVSFGDSEPGALAGLLKGSNQERQNQTVDRERLRSKPTVNSASSLIPSLTMLSHTHILFLTSYNTCVYCTTQHSSCPNQ